MNATQVVPRGFTNPRWHEEMESPDAGWSYAGSPTRVVEEETTWSDAGTTTRGALPARTRMKPLDVLTRVEARGFPYPRCRSEVVDEVTRDERHGVMYPLARTEGVATIRRGECDVGWIRSSLPESKLILSRILMFLKGFLDFLMETIRFTKDI